MEKITISNITIDVVRKDIKNIHLAVYPPMGRVRISAPLHVNDDAIRLFAISKLGWIKQNRRKFEGQERIPKREYKQREGHYFEGKRFLLNIIELDSKPKVEIKGKKRIDLYVRPNSTTKKKHEVLTEWYRSHLKKQIPPILEKWEKILDLKVDYWQVKQMKTKWGSCNIEKKRIWLNLELAKKPVRCLEYIIVHEMIHFKERHHNEKFLYYMNNYLPNWKQVRKELQSLPVSHADWSY
ncbi:MAG: M48 family metallopeptidase [Calditrichaceae bacterium]